MTWIHQALSAGGTLKMKSAVEGKCIIRAVMTWPDEKPVRGSCSTSAEGALESLEAALAEDAAAEMQRQNAV